MIFLIPLFFFTRQAADLNRGLGASATQQAVVQSFLRNFDQVKSILNSRENIIIQYYFYFIEFPPPPPS